MKAIWQNNRLEIAMINTNINRWQSVRLLFDKHIMDTTFSLIMGARLLTLWSRVLTKRQRLLIVPTTVKSVHNGLYLRNTTDSKAGFSHCEALAFTKRQRLLIVPTTVKSVHNGLYLSSTTTRQLGGEKKKTLCRKDTLSVSRYGLAELTCWWNHNGMDIQ